ncbi:MAG: hypothetical protein OEZ19_04645 [Paracoccaceae bacterium]|nr:hypothetical protein [Paracoccaceae bacterium]
MVDHCLNGFLAAKAFAVGMGRVYTALAEQEIPMQIAMLDDFERRLRPVTDDRVAERMEG